MAEVFDFGLQQHKIKMDGKFFENNLFAVAGDTGRRLEVQLLDSNNLVQDTTGISLRLNADVAGQATYAEATLVDATKGLYELDLPNGMLIAPGNWQFQWQIIGTSGEKLHSFAFMGTIGSNLAEGAAEGLNFYLNLEVLKQMQEDLVNGTFDSEVLETNIAEKLTDLETQYAPKLTEVTAQLAQNDSVLKNQGIASKDGLVPNGLDQTSSMNTYLEELNDKKIKKAIFDVAGTFKVDTSLNTGNKTLKTGLSKVSKKNVDNWFYEIVESEKTFEGKINSYGYGTLFTQIKTAIERDNTVHISFIGDSITTSGSTKATFKMRQATNYNGFVYSPNGASRGDAYPQRLMELLVQAFPTTTFIYTNYAIGGETLTNWKTSKTFDGETKSWIDFCKDATPDVLIVGFGMNHNTPDMASKFAYNQKQLLDYVNAFTVKPMVVFVTTPRPVYIPSNQTWGNYSNQSSRFNTANVCRAIANEYGAYVVDVGKISDIKRVGLDYTEPITKKMTIDDFEVTTNENTVSNGNGAYTLSAGGNIRLTKNPLKDFTIKLHMVFNVLANGVQNDLIVKFNDNYEKNNQCTYNPKGQTDVEKLDSNLRISDYTNWSNDGGYWTGNFVGTYTRSEAVLTIRKRGARIEYYIDDAETRLLQDYADTWDIHGDIQIEYANAAGGGVDIEKIEIWGSDYVNYAPSLTEEDFYGKFIDGDTETKEIYGGNGVNHPSSIAIEECYVPALKELVSDIKSTLI